MLVEAVVAVMTLLYCAGVMVAVLCEHLLSYMEHLDVIVSLGGLSYIFFIILVISLLMSTGIGMLMFQ